MHVCFWGAEGCRLAKTTEKELHRNNNEVRAAFGDIYLMWNVKDLLEPYLRYSEGFDAS